MKRKAIILGAGVSGLVTAWKLLECGWDVELLEKENAYGGMSRSWKWKEFIVDVGPHLFHTPDPQMADFWEKEFGDLFVKGEYWCCNVKGTKFDEYYSYPLSYEGIADFPKDVRQKVLKELEAVNAEERARARNYKEYVRALVGPTIQQMFFERYPEKVWGIPTGEMTPTWAPKRIELRQKKTPFYHGQWNAVGKYGAGCIYDRVYDKIVELGGRVRLNTTVTGFTVKGNVINEIKLANGPAITLAPNELVISTIPINLTARLLGVESKLTFRGITSIYLAFNKEFVIPEGLHWLYFDSPDLIFNRLSEQKKLSDVCAAPGKTCVTAEIAYTAGDEIDKTDPEKLIEKTLADLIRTGLVKKSEFAGGSWHKQPAVYPLLHKDYQHELARIQSHLGQFNQLYSIGTTGEFSYADSQILFQKAFDLVDILTDQFSDFAQVKRKQTVSKLNREVSLGDRLVGDGQRPFIIAEAGLNHNGSLEMATQLIDRAAEVGCDAIKFQTYKAENRVSGKVKKIRYAETIVGTEETLLEMFKRMELSLEDHKHLFDYAKKKGIAIFSTPFDFESVDLLESVGNPYYKLASFDLVNLPLLKYVAKTMKPLILSTGMSNLGQIEEALEAIRSVGNPNVVLLHCVSAYPAAPEDMNLKAIETMKKAFSVPVGLSDHTLGNMVSQVALAVGANVIERHFTLDRTLEGPDHILSSEANEMRELVRCASLLNRVMGDGIKKIQPSEYDTINTQRKSLYARVDIRKGDIISRDAIAIKGPGGGLQPVYLEIVEGRPAKREIKAEYPITWEDI